MQLNTTKKCVDVTIVKQPQKGFLGFIGSKPAIVEVELKPDASDREVVFNLEGEQIGLLIGKHGQMLDSLQHLVNLVGNRYSDQYVRIVLEPMNAADRKVVHTVVQNQKGVETYSSGEDPTRRVIITSN